MITANQAPDHATIARFRGPSRGGAGRAVRRGAGAVRARPGWSQVGVIAVDGTKMHANASQHANARLRADRARDPRGGRRASTPPRTSGSATRAATSCRRSWRTRRGRRGWLREAKQPTRRASAPREARPIPRVRPERLLECQAPAARTGARASSRQRQRRLHEAAIARDGRERDGRRFGATPKPYRAAGEPAGKINVTDPDSRNVKTPRG